MSSRFRSILSGKAPKPGILAFLITMVGSWLIGIKMVGFTAEQLGWASKGNGTRVATLSWLAQFVTPFLMLVLAYEVVGAVEAAERDRE